MEIRPLVMTPDEQAAVVELFSDELARGWIPTRPDLEAALHLVRRERDSARRAPAAWRSVA